MPPGSRRVIPTGLGGRRLSTSSRTQQATRQAEGNDSGAPTGCTRAVEEPHDRRAPGDDTPSVDGPRDTDGAGLPGSRRCRSTLGPGDLGDVGSTQGSAVGDDAPASDGRPFARCSVVVIRAGRRCSVASSRPGPQGRWKGPGPATVPCPRWASSATRSATRAGPPSWRSCARQRRPLAHLDVRNAATIDDIRADTVAAATAPNGPDTLVLVLGTAQANVFGPFESTVSAASGRTTCGACCGPPLDTSSASGCSTSRSARRVSTSGWTGTRRR